MSRPQLQQPQQHLPYENPQNINEYYFAILKRLVKQKALDPSLICLDKKETNLKFLQKVVENIFITMKADRVIYEASLKELLSVKDAQFEDFGGFDPNMLRKNASQHQVMSFAMIILYKTLPCPRGQQCKAKPREIAPYNQYADEELSCVFYHHHKDRRRIPITPRVRDEFLYKANYDRKKEVQNNAKYSRNYFESIYHPIYYKLFKCKRVGCNQAYYCPFNHNESEKTLWDEIFQIYFLKKREMYTGKNYNSSLKELTKISFDTIDLYPQSPEREYPTRMNSRQNAPGLGGEFRGRENLSMDQFSDDYNTDLYYSDNEDSFGNDIDDLTNEDDYDISFDSKILSATRTPTLNPKSPNSYMNSPLFSFAQSPALTGINYMRSPALSFSQANELGLHNEFSSPGFNTRNPLELYSRKYSTKQVTLSNSLSPTKDTFRSDSQNEEDLTYPPGLRPTCASLPNISEANHGPIGGSIKIRNNTSYEDIPPPTPFQDQDQSIGPLGHFFDWDKVKNIMSLQLSRPSA